MIKLEKWHGKKFLVLKIGKLKIEIRISFSWE
jgi:hypothetical protein